MLLGLLVPALSQRSCFGSWSGVAAGYDWSFKESLDGHILSVHVLNGHGRMTRRLLGRIPPFGFVGPGLRSGLRKGVSE